MRKFKSRNWDYIVLTLDRLRDSLTHSCKHSGNLDSRILNINRKKSVSRPQIQGISFLRVFLSLKCNDEWDLNSGSPSKRPLLPGTSNNKGRVSLLGRVLQKQTSRPNFQLNLTQDHDRRAAEDHARWEIVLLFPVLFWWQISHVSPNVEILATQDNWYVLVKKILHYKTHETQLPMLQMEKESG